MIKDDGSQAYLSGSLVFGFFPVIIRSHQNSAIHRLLTIVEILRQLSFYLFCVTGGQDEYGPFCGTSSLLSAVKRLLWVCGFGACLPAPGPVHQLVDRRILAFLRDKFNPLRHSEVSTKLPPPRRFRVNENFVTYGGDKKEKDLGAQGEPC